VFSRAIGRNGAIVGLWHGNDVFKKFSLAKGVTTKIGKYGNGLPRSIQLGYWNSDWTLAPNMSR
jgi:hypothetical protein